MKQLLCRCGRPVFFDNHTCINCGRELAFDPLLLEMRAAGADEEPLQFCANRKSASRCNWLADSSSSQGVCLSCGTSKVIPALSKRINQRRWRKLEDAKRRLIYELLSLGLPVNADHLQFMFKEDQSTNPNVPDTHISTGHADGVITINAAEADEVYREQMRQQMNEPYRTLLGHFRHESGHYYFNIIVNDTLRPTERALFGDETMDYGAALQRHYQNGPPPGWEQAYISSYATAHPSEDWAETWAHYLHIRAVLEVAEATGLRVKVSIENWQKEFIGLVLAINEVMRSLGLPDAYPFVITETIARKIEFVHTAVNTFSGRPDEL
jgi:hypothetical protein